MLLLSTRQAPPKVRKTFSCVCPPSLGLCLDELGHAPFVLSTDLSTPLLCLSIDPDEGSSVTVFVA